MRDSKRIKEIFSLLEEIWTKDTDLRFSQLMYNLQRDYSNNHDGFGLVEGNDADGFTKAGFDFFNLEDEEFMEYLRSLKKKTP
jgi:hypothetical protein